MQDLRTKRTRARYEKAKMEGGLIHGCPLCQEKSIKEFKHWKILDNKYPWDLIAETNHMIIPKRHSVYEELSREEKEEFDLIKFEYLEKEYTHIIEVSTREKSIPGHFHEHLIILKNKIKV